MPNINNDLDSHFKRFDSYRRSNSNISSARAIQTAPASNSKNSTTTKSSWTDIKNRQYYDKYDTRILQNRDETFNSNNSNSQNKQNHSSVNEGKVYEMLFGGKNEMSHHSKPNNNSNRRDIKDMILETRLSDDWVDSDDVNTADTYNSSSSNSSNSNSRRSIGNDNNNTKSNRPNGERPGVLLVASPSVLSEGSDESNTPSIVYESRKYYSSKKNAMASSSYSEPRRQTRQTYYKQQHNPRVTIKESPSTTSDEENKSPSQSSITSSVTFQLSPSRHNQRQPSEVPSSMKRLSNRGTNFTIKDESLSGDDTSGENKQPGLSSVSEPRFQSRRLYSHYTSSPSKRQPILKKRSNNINSNNNKFDTTKNNNIVNLAKSRIKYLNTSSNNRNNNKSREVLNQAHKNVDKQVDDSSAADKTGTDASTSADSYRQKCNQYMEDMKNLRDIIRRQDEEIALLKEQLSRSIESKYDLALSCTDMENEIQQQKQQQQQQQQQKKNRNIFGGNNHRRTMINSDAAKTDEGKSEELIKELTLQVSELKNKHQQDMLDKDYLVSKLVGENKAMSDRLRSIDLDKEIYALEKQNISLCK